MFIYLFYLLVGVASIAAFYGSRYALWLLLLVGFTQDMARKMVFGEPVYFVLMVAFVFIAYLAGIWAREGVSKSYEPFIKWSKSLTLPILVFVLILLAQFFHSWLRYSNPFVAVLGLFSYLAPFLAVIVGYSLVNSMDDVRKFLISYAAFGGIVAVTVILSFIGYDFLIFKEVGAGLRIYDQGTVLRSHSGIMRTGEVAAWHIGASACFIIGLVFSSKQKFNVLVAALIVIVLMTAIALTGRRKMIMSISLFAVFFVSANYYYRNAFDIRFLYAIFAAGIFAWFGIDLFIDNQSDTALVDYFARGSSVYGDAGSRFLDLGLTPIHWAYNRVGLLGGGLGIASQGAHLFGIDIAGGSGEGGLGKIMVELGLPGLLCVAWVLFSLLRFVNRTLELSAQRQISAHMMPLFCSLVVFLSVNMMTFSVASQLYSDMFVLILIGLIGGFVFALPKLASQSIVEHYLAQDALQKPNLTTSDQTAK